MIPSSIKSLCKVFINHFDKKNCMFRYYSGKKNIGKFEKLRNRKKIFFMMVPSYGNVGDQGIVFATNKFLREYFKEYTIIEIDFDETVQHIKEIKRVCSPEDLIFLQGGGNFGTLYKDAEITRRFIISHFPDNHIISMPQSFYYDSAPASEKFLKEGIKIYNSHKKLTLFAREKYSYSQMKKYYNSSKVLLNPDIVLFLGSFYDPPYTERKHILCCLRNDEESVLSSKRNNIIESLTNKFSDVVLSDTCVARRITKETRKFEIDSLLKNFLNSKVVITDRLHGMVFAALTSTPCVVLASLDNKVLGTYEWIKDINYIKFCDKSDISDILKITEKLIDIKPEKYDWMKLRKNFFDKMRIRIENEG